MDFFPEYYVNKPVINKKYVTGVSGYKKYSFLTRSFNLKADIIVDSSGTSAVLRKKIPPSFKIKNNLRIQDFASAWQEAWTVGNKKKFRLKNGIKIKPGTTHTKIGTYQAYTSFYLRKDNTFTAIFGSSLSENNLAYFLCKKYINEIRGKSKKIYADGGVIPIRRNLDNLVGNGFLLLGDSACQVIPTMGSGIQSSLIAPSIAGNVIINALNEKNYSKDFLWKYNFK